MTKPMHPEAPERLDCDVCLTQIPADSAINAECAEYIYHFCGIDRYREWLDDQPRAVGEN